MTHHTQLIDVKTRCKYSVPYHNLALIYSSDSTTLVATFKSVNICLPLTSAFSPAFGSAFSCAFASTSDHPFAFAVTLTYKTAFRLMLKQASTAGNRPTFQGSYHSVAAPPYYGYWESGRLRTVRFQSQTTSSFRISADFRITHSAILIDFLSRNNASRNSKAATITTGSRYIISKSSNISNAY